MGYGRRSEGLQSEYPVSHGIKLPGNSEKWLRNGPFTSDACMGEGVSPWFDFYVRDVTKWHRAALVLALEAYEC